MAAPWRLKIAVLQADMAGHRPTGTNGAWALNTAWPVKYCGGGPSIGWHSITLVHQAVFCSGSLVIDMHASNEESEEGRHRRT